MASIQQIVGYGGTIEKQTAPSGAAAYIVRVTDGPVSAPFAKRVDAEKWLHKYAKVISTNYRAQVRVKGRCSESATFSSRAKAEKWANSLETAIEEGRHFPHAAARRTSFDALAKDYTETVLAKFDDTQRDTRSKQIADVLGHKTLAMVKRYSHLVVDHKAGVIERMIAAKGL
jgi:hypothetical protein